jgi:hypothetical protein
MERGNEPSSVKAPHEAGRQPAVFDTGQVLMVFLTTVVQYLRDWLFTPTIINAK